MNRTGAGWTIYLNTAWDQYPKQRACKFGGAAYRQLASAILSKAGIKPAIQVTSPDGKPVIAGTNRSLQIRQRRDPCDCEGERRHLRA